MLAFHECQLADALQQQKDQNRQRVDKLRNELDQHRAQAEVLRWELGQVRSRCTCGAAGPVEVLVQ